MTDPAEASSGPELEPPELAPATAAPAPPRPRLSLARNPDFLKLWIGQTISQFGSEVTVLAIPLIAINTLKASPFEVGLLGTIQFLPFIVFGLPAGVYVDRFRRRPILIAGDFGRAVVLLSIPAAYVAGVLTIWQLFVVGFLTGTLTVFFDVSYQSYLPSLVERDQLVDGNGKLEATRSAAYIGGPGLGGFLIGLVTAPLAIVADAASFLASVAFLLGIRRPEPAAVGRTREAEGPRPGLRREAAGGLRYVLGHPYLRWIAACTAFSNLFGTMWGGIVLVYVVRVLGLTATTIGLYTGIANIGALLGAVTAARLAGRIGVGRAIVGSVFIGDVAALLVPLAPKANPVPVLILAFGVTGFCTLVYNINQVSFRQAITPHEMQGRMNATMRFIVWGTIPIGTTAGGILGSTIGLLPTIWIGTVGSLFAVLPVALTRVRTLREIPAGPIDYEDPTAPRPEPSRPPES